MNESIENFSRYTQATTAHYLMQRLENVLYNEELTTGLVGADKIWNFILEIKKEFNLPEDEIAQEDIQEPQEFQSIEELTNPNE